jgi:hypothetical protein
MKINRFIKKKYLLNKNPILIFSIRKKTGSEILKDFIKKAREDKGELKKHGFEYDKLTKGYFKTFMGKKYEDGPDNPDDPDIYDENFLTSENIDKVIKETNKKYLDKDYKPSEKTFKLRNDESYMQSKFVPEYDNIRKRREIDSKIPVEERDATEVGEKSKIKYKINRNINKL